MKIRTLLTILLFLLVNFLLFGGHSMAIEKLTYTVIEREQNFELRQYDPHIVAETFVDGDFDDVGNKGFRRLADYIFGKNRQKNKIAMTAPVNQEATSGIWRITFVMPSKYTLETLPEPLDSRVLLKEMPGRLVAALKYSGTWSRERYEKKKAQLELLIQQRGFQSFLH